MIACGKKYRCKYNKVPDAQDRKVILVYSSTLLDAIALSYMHIVNLLTTNTSRVVITSTVLEVVATLLIAISFLYTTIRLISRYTTMLSITNYSKGNYEYEIEALYFYLQVSNMYFLF